MFLELLLLSYAGILLHFGFKMQSAYSNGSLSVFFSRKSLIGQAIGLFVSVMCSTLIVYVREDISNIFVVTPVGAAIVGYSGQSIFAKILSARSPKEIKPIPDNE